MSSFGTLYRVHTYGESHCKSVGCIVDGVPPVRPPGSRLVQRLMVLGTDVDRGGHPGSAVTKAAWTE